MINPETGRLQCDICMACGCGVQINKIQNQDVCVNCKPASFLNKVSGGLLGNVAEVLPEKELDYSKKDCGFTRTLFMFWKIKLKCVEDNNKISDIGLDQERFSKLRETLEIAITEVDSTGDACKYYFKLVKIQALMNNIIKVKC